MKRAPYKKVFVDKQKLEAMKVLRQNGWTAHSIALVFGIDYSSVLYQCRKFDIHKGEKNVDFSLGYILSMLGVRSPEEKRIKTYQDYLAMAGYKGQVPKASDSHFAVINYISEY